MMRNVLIVAIVSMLGLTACGDAGLGVNPSEALLKPVRVYEVDAWGSNPDIYEFTPVGHEHMTCLILVSGEDNSTGLECFPSKG